MAPVFDPVAQREPTLTLLHGFTNTSETWGDFRTLLAQAYGVTALDLPGHGENHRIRQRLDEFGQTLAQRLTEPTVLIGYSLGGRAALHCALEQPLGLRGLVLIGATAGIEDSAERAERRRSDEALAEHLRETNDVAQFIDAWLSGPLFARLSDEQRQVEGRLNNTAEGLASSLELMGVGTQASLWGELQRVQVPTLIIAGGDDEKFTKLGQRLAREIPSGQFVSIDGAGHAVHLEAPERCASAIVRFVAGLAQSAVSGPEEATS